MNAPGHPLSTGAPIGMPHPLPADFRKLPAAPVPSRATTGHRMKHEPAALHVSYDEALTIAADLVRIWPGMTGLNEVPKVENAADLVQRALRKARELIAARQAEEAGLMHIPDNEVPY